MKKATALISVGLVIINLSGCALLRPSAAEQKATRVPAALPSYSGLKAKIAVADCDVQAAKATREIGSGLRQMFITALTDSNRFIITEQPVVNGKPRDENSPAPDSGADLIIAIAVNEFEPQVSGGSSGMGGGGGVGSGVLGGLLGTNLNKAHMALDVRIITASNSEVLASTRVQGQASDVSGAHQGGEFGSWALSKGLSAYADTPMEKAIRATIIEAVRYISQTIPASYYKY
ncbi:MAG: CsgG/HfaB family protein [Candidatus Omnitrophota bacterium]|nr:CsgG/HfaB family protein [Candidatus Omnitrophota bacterium]